MSTNALQIFLQHEYDVRFKLTRRDLFYFLLTRVPLPVIASMFLVHPAILRDRLVSLLPPIDQEIALVQWF